MAEIKVPNPVSIATSFAAEFSPRDIEPSRAPVHPIQTVEAYTFQLHKDPPTSLLESAEEFLF